jgi:hypothetical protein
MSSAVEEFRRGAEPVSQGPALCALWHDAQGNWDRAHELAQESGDADGDWVHAYLHRKEGDDANAAYWYARAKRKKPAGALQSEWEEIVGTLLDRARGR